MPAIRAAQALGLVEDDMAVQLASGEGPDADAHEWAQEPAVDAETAVAASDEATQRSGGGDVLDRPVARSTGSAAQCGGRQGGTRALRPVAATCKRTKKVPFEADA